MLGEDGQKMSKSKRNYREPGEIFDRYGADALRWYFFANQPPWTSIRYSEQAIKDSIPEFLLRLWNVYSFLRDLRQHRWLRSGGRALAGEAGEFAPEELAAGQGYRPGRRAQRVGSMDPERVGSHRGRRRRADGRLRQLRRLCADHGVRRRADELVRPPQPRPLLERRPAQKVPTSSTPIGRCTNAC